MRSTFSYRLPGLLAGLLLALALSCLALPAAAQSMRFFGTGDNDEDRVKIRIDGGQPANIGSTFTIEVWLKPDGPQSNAAPPRSAGANYDWIYGNTFFDRDRYNQLPGFGISLTAGRVTFGVKTSTGPETWRARTDIRTGTWHHVVVQRSGSSGSVQIYVDGVREVNDVTGPTGSLAYPPGATPIPLGLQGDSYLVLGAEKHDADPAGAPSYFGLMAELRISNIIRYTTEQFVPQAQPFMEDVGTLALYHFGEMAGSILVDTAANVGGSSNGEVRFNAGATRPAWSSDSPFGSTSPGSLQWVSSSAAVSEGAGSIALSVSRLGGDTGAVSINYATANGNASAGNDYTSTSGTLNWADGDTAAKTVSVPILNDSTFESAETFSVVLSNVTGGASVGSPAVVTVTINDNDQAPVAGSLQFSVATASVAEGAGSLTVTVTRIGGSSGEVSVSYATANGTASAGNDFTAASGQLTWNAGQTGSQTFTVAILDDATQESAETFSLSLANPSNGAVLGSPASMTVTVTDNDSASTGGGSPSSGGGGGSLDLATLGILLLAIVGARGSAARFLFQRPVAAACTVIWLRASTARATLPSSHAFPCPLDPPRYRHRWAISLDSHTFP